MAAIGIAAAACTSSNTGHSGPAQLKETFQGTISIVDATGGSICITPPNGTQRCGIPFMQPGAPKLQVGDQVGIQVEQIYLDPNRSEEIFVVYSPAPS